MRTFLTFTAALCLCAGPVLADNDYMVEKGDSLIKIGKLFGVPYKEIMRVNNLTTTTIHPDQILRIPAGGRSDDRDQAQLAHAAEVKAAQESEVPATIEIPAPEIENKESVAMARSELPGYSDIAPVKQNQDAGYTQAAYIPPVQGASKARPAGPKAPDTYTVREGDTLWNISRRFGVDAVDLKKVNKLIHTDRIQIGQVLTLPSKVTIAAN